ncbi:hypothetical protein SDC9_134965 [bioreactor metagenome]|uniref:Uncharacterized protein n=1 Tax=bioreactor metagenome TaxID=1076179 RepID=A0A645DF70_9ZZZZ
MNFSVMPTLMLKFVISLSCFLHCMKSMISGWSIRNMPILAPRRVPPCLTASVAALNTFIKLIGPLATPPVERTDEPAERRREKLKPVPPPLLWMSAAFLTVSKISSIESPTGKTKQAESWPSGLPAFMSVGEFGMNLSSVIRSKNTSSVLLTSLFSSKSASPCAIAFATRLNMPSMVSVKLPSTSFERYLLFNTVSALAVMLSMVFLPQ